MKRAQHLPALPWVLWVAWLTSAPCHAVASEVVLDTRLRPGQDMVMATTNDVLTTLRVVEDRGLVAKSGGRLSTQPLTVNVSTTQSARYLTGPAQADGSFRVELRYLTMRTVVTMPDGRAQEMPSRVPLVGLSVAAVVEGSGQVRQDTLAITGDGAAEVQPLRGTFVATLQQATSMPPVTLQPGGSTPQVISMQLPVPMVGNLSLRLNVQNRLLDVTEGIANIQQVYALEFGSPPGEMKMTAQGSGGGTMRYAVAPRLLQSLQSGWLAKMRLEMPDGTLEFEMNAQSSQQMRPSE